ncbi:MAG TPA: hypothetical protein VG733_08340 [Chthoniobacteraceae bacterium]|nr:hypothetical protein [Chthoniobacteraceae bacterium]
MIRTILNHLIPAQAGAASTEVTLSHEGMSYGLALLLLVILGAAAFWAYHWGAPGFSRFRRAFLASLRVALIGLFILLLVKPVLMLTINQPIREKLLVLIDTTQSMTIKDRRGSDDDQKRAAIAAGLIAPSAGLNGSAPGDGKWNSASRADLINAIAGNSQLNLWSRLQEKADLDFYSMDREAKSIGAPRKAEGEDTHIDLDSAKDFFQKVQYNGDETALGDSLQKVLAENRGQPVCGIMLITDGGNNTGVAPEEIAQLAKDDGLPLYLYGVGITKPKDIVVHDISGSRGVFVKEHAEFNVKVRGSGYAGETAKLVLKADGKVVDTQDITLSDNDAEYKLGYNPQEKGEATVEASIDPRPDESDTDNNAVSTKVRILDTKVDVLYIEGDPRWDFRYLLAQLQRDRRLNVKCALLNGDPDLGTEANSPFLKGLPSDRAEIVSNKIIILGDVDPAELGQARMKLLNEWVSDMGGGLIFLSGPRYNPFHYAGTPLEPLLPVELLQGLTEGQYAANSWPPIQLKLTPSGEASDVMKLSDDPDLNRKIWNSFTGVRWTARVAKARPTAQVFLEDSRPALASRDDLMPVIAQQQYGKGLVMYFGTDETYKWRSTIGEKFYIRLWDQVIQSFSLDRQLGASARTQLKVEKPVYLPNDKVVISGQIYNEKFSPLTDATVPGIMTITGTDGKETKENVSLTSDPQTPGQYELDYPAKIVGSYQFATIIDPNALLKFDVISPKIEFADTALNADLLQNMANISGGKFLREEDLNGLPALVSSNTATVPTFKKLDLVYSPWWMGALMALAVLEWLFRRLWQLK